MASWFSSIKILAGGSILIILILLVGCTVMPPFQEVAGQTEDEPPSYSEIPAPVATVIDLTEPIDLDCEQINKQPGFPEDTYDILLIPDKNYFKGFSHYRKISSASVATFLDGWPIAKHKNQFKFYVLKTEKNLENFLGIISKIDNALSSDEIRGHLSINCGGKVAKVDLISTMILLENFGDVSSGIATNKFTGMRHDKEGRPTIGFLATQEGVTLSHELGHFFTLGEEYKLSFGPNRPDTEFCSFSEDCNLRGFSLKGCGGIMCTELINIPQDKRPETCCVYVVSSDDMSGHDSSKDYGKGVRRSEVSVMSIFPNTAYSYSPCEPISHNPSINKKYEADRAACLEPKNHYTYGSIGSYAVEKILENYAPTEFMQKKYTFGATGFEKKLMDKVDYASIPLIIECKEDLDCDDQNALTLDNCVVPYAKPDKRAYCQHLITKECSTDSDCGEEQFCDNGQRLCRLISLCKDDEYIKNHKCTSEGVCKTDKDCDDKNPLTTDKCEFYPFGIVIRGVYPEAICAHDKTNT